MKYSNKTIDKIIKMTDNMLNKWALEDDINPHEEINDLLSQIKKLKHK